MRRFLVLAVVAALAACGRDEVFPRGNGPGGGGQGGGTAGGFGGGSAGGQGGGTAGGFGGGTAGGFGGGSAGGQGGGTAGGFGGGSAGGQGGGTAGGSGGGGSAGGQGGGGMSIDTPCSEPVAAPTLLALRASMVGTWRGKQVSPWQAPQQVEFTFRANGTYSARNLNSAGGPALYYGTDADSATKTYQVTDLHTNGDGKGTIRVVFSVGQMGNVGTLDVIRVCDVSRRLDFEFYPSWLGMIGPVEFRLARFP